MDDLILARAYAACAATGATLPQLIGPIIAEHLGRDDDGNVFGINPRTGEKRFGLHGLPMTAEAVALELKNDPELAPAWAPRRNR